MHCFEWNNYSWIKQAPSRMDVLFLISVFLLYPEIKKTFKHNSVRKNLFLSACFCWDSGLSLREMEQKFKFGGPIGYGNSCLDSVFRYSKVFRLHAILHDVAGAVRPHSVKDLTTATWLVEVQILTCLVTWLDYNLSLRKNLATLHFQLCRPLKQYALHCTRYRANWEEYN